MERGVSFWHGFGTKIHNKCDQKSMQKLMPKKVSKIDAKNDQQIRRPSVGRVRPCSRRDSGGGLPPPYPPPPWGSPPTLRKGSFKRCKILVRGCLKRKMAAAPSSVRLWEFFVKISKLSNTSRGVGVENFPAIRVHNPWEGLLKRMPWARLQGRSG